MLNCNKINGFFILHRSGRKKICSANMTSKLVSKIKGGQSKKGKYVFLPNGLFYQMVCHVNVCEAMSSRNGILIRPPRSQYVVGCTRTLVKVLQSLKNMSLNVKYVPVLTSSVRE